MQAPERPAHARPWTTPLPNGTYDVTVGVGDATAINSVYEVTAQPGTADATTIIDHVTPDGGRAVRDRDQAGHRHQRPLVLDPTGGTQTKIDFVDAVPAAADTTKPVVTSVALGGTLSAGAGSPYSSTVTVTASATDNVGVTGMSYTLDGGASTAVHRSVRGDQRRRPHGRRHRRGRRRQRRHGDLDVHHRAACADQPARQLRSADQRDGPAGYVNDYGLAFTAPPAGWENANDGTPLAGRQRPRAQLAPLAGQALRHHDPDAADARPRAAR